MKNRKLCMLAVILGIVLLMNSCGGLFLSSEAENLVGFWESEPWLDYGDNCYYDFRDDGRVYVTDWTANFPLYNNWMVPLPLSMTYNVSGDSLTMSQYFGFVNFEFEGSDFSSDTITLTVMETTGSYNLYEGDTLVLTRILDPTDEQAAARAFLQEASNE